MCDCWSVGSGTVCNTCGLVIRGGSCRCGARGPRGPPPEGCADCEFPNTVRK